MAKIPDLEIKVNVLEVSVLQELAEEFRRLAAEAWGKTEDVPANGGLSAEDAVHHDATAQAFTQAAQMVEEKLNG